MSVNPYQIDPGQKLATLNRVLAHRQAARKNVKVGDRGRDLLYGMVEVVAIVPGMFTTITLRDDRGTEYLVHQREWSGLIPDTAAAPCHEDRSL